MSVFFIFFGLFCGAVLIVSLLMFGAGYLVALLLPIAATQATALVLASAIFVILITFSVGTLSVLKKTVDEDEIDAEVFDIIEKEIKEELRRKPNKMGRNSLCQCGSRKKYKYCCMKAE